MKMPTSRNGTSNICRVLRKITAVTESACDEPMIRADIITPAISSAFLPPMRLMINGAKNMINALRNSPSVVT
ncbi:hypothetical protein D3C80_2083740 [compost metagenome]